MIRVVIALSSVVVREALADVLRSDSTLTIVGQANNGIEALDLVKRLQPDIVVMDAFLPKMDGFEATKRIMIEKPTPIVILSEGLDGREVELSMHALRAGALKVSRRPPLPQSSGHDEARAEFIAIVKAMSQVKLVRRWNERRAAGRSPSLSTRKEQHRIVAIAASTGGPAALQHLLSELPADFSIPILVVQHITIGFVGGLATWLNTASALKVKIAEHGEPLAPQTVFFAPDNSHLGVMSDATIVLSRAAPIHGFRPSADFLFNSVAQVFGASVIAVVLTGMGQDGVAGLRKVRDAGGRVFVQDEATSVVFGMPRAAIEAGLAGAVLPLPAIAPRLVKMACQ